MEGPESVAAQTDFGSVSAPGLRDIQMGGPQQVQAPSDLERLQMGPAEQVQAEKFGLSSLQPYMSPYMQDVVETQKREALRDVARQIPGMGAAAARAGGRGGSREALLQSESRRNLANQLQGIQATGTRWLTSRQGLPPDSRTLPHGSVSSS